MSFHSAWRKEAHGLQALWHSLHAGQSHWLLHGLFGGRLCGLLELWALPAKRATRCCGMNPAVLRFGGRGVYVSGDRAAPGDAILVSGTLGDHGIAVLSKRESLAFETEIVSDSAALHGLVADMVAAVPSIYCLRDPTRGGLGATLNEIAQQSRIGMRVAESAIPFKPDVLAACERACADRLLAVMRRPSPRQGRRYYRRSCAGPPCLRA